MKKLFFKINNLTEKLYLIIYQITIVFTLFFYVVIKGASGHQFIITNEEKGYSLLLFLAFLLSGFYKERRRFNRSVKKLILYLLLLFSIVTFGMSIYFLYFTFTFDYGFSVELIFVFFVFFLLPMLFTWCNFYLIRNIIKELKK